MLYFIAKFVLSGLLIVTISELAKRSAPFAALVASLPLTSVLAFIWLRVEGAGPEEIAELSRQIFWLIIPSLLLFVVFPIFLQSGMGFWISLSASAVLTITAYISLLPLLRRMGVGL